MFGAERNQAIKEEVEKLLKAKYIRPVQYPEWLANVVLVPKPNGKWRLCIDFTDLNKACPKPFPPSADRHVGRLHLWLRNVKFSRCLPRLQPNPLAPEDQEKASFITDQGVFCYNVMPFGLKNAGATYQRLVNYMFRNQIGRNMETRALPFFKVLRGVAKFEWNNTSQLAFDDLKRYLVSPPLLTKPKMGDTLFIYLAVSESAVSAVLVRQECREHQPVYYVSKVLQGAEIKYSQIEKLALALVVAARKLRPYFQSHQVVVLTNHHLKQVLTNPELSGRMEWAVELSEFGIEFRQDQLLKLKKRGGVVLESPQGDKLEYAIKLEYPSSNNEAEYEALLAGGELALAAGAKKIVIYSDSQLVVNRSEDHMKPETKKMAQYFVKAKNLLDKFGEASVVQISRADNAADQLAKLASSMSAIRNRKITFISTRAPYYKEKRRSCARPRQQLAGKRRSLDSSSKGLSLKVKKMQRN
ncbi:UNVERIFIED_CONTAM: Transposon Ty3-G Gag-Pol polyprotein [Sesamum radiatum]|uniref:Transposon Ty3-G Gag-Pol polyprotein n=1 Tax=Sesamum radiatum TaxID=300843 RepID=A0AAW2T1D0_SESRA